MSVGEKLFQILTREIEYRYDVSTFKAELHKAHNYIVANGYISSQRTHLVAATSCGF
ncbi:MAG TPA: hypothetical protein EYH02_01965 [Ignisphaera aggregans]|uniref:Uncharacterized protein n=1 Tax=Ignisphaera aggregans TaxID=334771 RepID=A0A832YZ66_9CREN|nr:hypothetical protein [Ignisphaera aggregans]